MLVFNEEKHEYRDSESGLLVPSVTTILSHISAVGYSNISESVLDYARARGSAVHSALELYDYGIPFEEQEEMTPEIFGYIQAYLNFLRDYSPKWTHIEHIVHNKKRNYCGTIDRAGVIDGRRCIVDLKCIASPTAENKICVCAQTWAYGQALYGSVPYDRYALYLKSDGKYNFFNCSKYEDEKGFIPQQVFWHCKCLNEYIANAKVKKGKK